MRRRLVGARYDVPRSPVIPPEPGSLWRHRKGGVYRVVCVARHTETDEDLVVYLLSAASDDASVWVRPLVVFLDGRFERL